MPKASAAGDLGMVRLSLKDRFSLEVEVQVAIGFVAGSLLAGRSHKLSFFCMLVVTHKTVLVVSWHS